MGGPDISFGEERPQVRPPSIPSPAQDLFQKPPVWLHGTQQFSFLAALNVRGPAMGNHPPSQELVVPGVQMVFAQPIVVSEAVNEFGVLEDDCSIRCGTTGQAADTTVDMG